MTEETNDDEKKSDEKSDDDEKLDEKKSDEKLEEPKVEAKPAPKPRTAKTTRTGAGWRPSWYRVGMGDLFIGIALLIAGTVVAMRTPTRWYGAFIVGTIETVHGLYLLSKKKQ